MGALGELIGLALFGAVGTVGIAVFVMVGSFAATWVLIALTGLGLWGIKGLLWPRIWHHRDEGMAVFVGIVLVALWCIALVARYPEQAGHVGSVFVSAVTR